MKCFISVDFTHSNTYKLFSLKKKWVRENTFLSVLLCNFARNQNATEHPTYCDPHRDFTDCNLTWPTCNLSFLFKSEKHSHYNSPSFHLLVHHVLNSPFDLGKGCRLTAVIQHCYHRVHTPEHLSQHLVMVWQREARGGRLGKGVVPLVCWLLSTEGEEKGKTV